MMIGGVLDRCLPSTRRREQERLPVKMRVGERRLPPKILDMSPGRLCPSPSSRMIGQELRGRSDGQQQ
jgi:hypothetical protein